MGDILSTLIYWLVPSLIAAVVIMFLSGIIEHKLQFKQALILGLAANIIPQLIDSYYNQIYSYIPSASLIIGTMSLGSIVVTLIFWVGLAAILMKESEMKDRIKIGALGFAITEILLFVIKFF
jgi:hypothetical protein